MDPVDIITADHQRVEDLFAEYEELDSDDPGEARERVDTLFQELESHARMEEQLVYPRLKESFETEEEDADVDEAYAEHDAVRGMIEELRKLDVADSQFATKMAALHEHVLRHVTEEEGELLPRMQETLSEDELVELGDALADFKEAQA